MLYGLLGVEAPPERGEQERRNREQPRPASRVIGEIAKSRDGLQRQQRAGDEKREEEIAGVQAEIRMQRRLLARQRDRSVPPPEREERGDRNAVRQRIREDLAPRLHAALAPERPDRKRREQSGPDDFVLAHVDQHDEQRGGKPVSRGDRRERRPHEQREREHVGVDEEEERRQDRQHDQLRRRERFGAGPEPAAQRVEAGDADQRECGVDESRGVERIGARDPQDRGDDRVIAGDRRQVAREDAEFAVYEELDLREVIELVGVRAAMTHREQRRDEQYAEHDAADERVGVASTSATSMRHP